MLINAPAKINLYLHITGKRDDGYHLLDSLVVFAEICDTIEVAVDDSVTLSVTGPYADEIDCTHNTLIKAATLLRERFGITQGARITLRKHLPVGAGIGGGSADAAAALRLLVKLWEITIAPEALADIGLKIGADVPACLHQTALYMEGIGEIITPVKAMPLLYMVLVNPRKALLTKEVFANYHGKFRTPLKHPMAFASGEQCVDFLRATGNDLQEASIKIMPEILQVLETIERQQGCMLSRMSGSGATCFGLFPTPVAADAAAHAIHTEFPQWWCMAATAGQHYE